MSQINILDSSVYNKISAGEVVERPMSIIKELVENALDAGARNINISIENGGISKIVVLDDGCGMSPEDAVKAFYPHATSKISNENDLSSIKTLGFRGEALASIAAVSIATLSTRTAEADTGVCIKNVGGEVVSTSEVAINVGSGMEINDLFYNTPARKKFLKKPKQEESEITNLVSRYILINCNICFKYTVDGKLVFQSLGSNLSDAIFTVYGKETAQNILEVKNDYLGMRLYGYIGKPSYSKPNRTYQTIALNGRYIVNTQISAAIFNAYSEYLMKRNYPFYVLSLTIDPEKIDVNVHPNKMDVRFEHSNEVFSMMYGGVKHVLQEYGASSIKSFSDAICNNIQQPLNKIFDDRDSNVKNENEQKDDDSYSFSNVFKEPIMQLRDIRASSTHNPMPIISFSETPRNVDEIDVVKKSENLKVNETITQESLQLGSKYKIIGQLFSTYIIVESGEQIYLIDQHAAHERILFDKLTAAKIEQSFQQLLLPYVFSVNALEDSFIREQLFELKRLGIDIDEFGDCTYRISCVPSELCGIDFDIFIKEILFDYSYKKGKKAEFDHNYYASKACKAAIKAGQSLSQGEIELLLKKMAGGSILQCPHGRPVAVIMTKYEIEKMFKRIV